MGEEGGVDGPLFSALWLRSDVCASWPLRRAMGGGARAWAGLRVGRRVGRGCGGMPGGVDDGPIGRAKPSRAFILRLAPSQ